MTRIDELALKCGVSRSTVMNVAKRIHEIEGGGKVWRYPTEEEINNRKQYYKKSGRPTKFKIKEE